MVSRLSSFVQSKGILDNIKHAQKKLYDAQVRAATAKKSQDYAGIYQRANNLLNIEATITKVSQYVENNSLVNLRLQAMESTLASLTELASQFRVQLFSGMNAQNAKTGFLNMEATLALDKIESLLNSQQDNRFLFSGAMTNMRPVDLSKLSIPSTGSSPDFSYAIASAKKMSAVIDDGLKISYGFTAFEPAIETLIRGVKLTATSNNGNGADIPRLQEAEVLISEAIRGLSGLRGEIGISQSQVENTVSMHENFKVFLNENAAAILAMDVPESVEYLNQARQQLEASYMALRTLRDLNILKHVG